ncbi:sugar ABC transporter substrate-binding protein [Frankia gtarii]|uniref:sugar ABC transporter substrate-binding protein n=1 Tax=Frankia gtarii TaxID=2950102 RepID=UPI0021C0A719|nr:sugar ABC transporter substrate-binding protein [Frankia gtarii]
MSAAQAEVDKLLKPPTSIGIDQPLREKPRGGQTIVFLSCETGLCQVLGSGMKDAAHAAGLQYKSLPITLANPATLIAGMQQALQMNPKPVGVVFAGIPEAVWAGQVPAFEKAGVPLIPVAVGEVKTGPAVPAGLDGPVDARAQAAAVANYFIADSNGKGKALAVNVPDVGALKIAIDAFTTTVRKGCTDCVTDTVDLTLAQVASNGVVPAVVSALQRKPDITYVMTPQGEWTQGLQAAVRAAGLDKVQLIGINPAKFNQQELLTGDSAAFSLLPFKIMAWKGVDIALRHAEGTPVRDSAVLLPLQLLTKATVGTPADSIDRPTDYQAQFTKLWKLS